MILLVAITVALSCKNALIVIIPTELSALIIQLLSVTLTNLHLFCTPLNMNVTFELGGVVVAVILSCS